MARQFTLSKDERLKSRKQIDQLFREGKSFVVSPYRVYFRFENGLPAKLRSNVQVGVGVSGKFFKKAVDRNRIKRLMRETWRLQKPSLLETAKHKNLLIDVFLIYTSNELPEYQLMLKKAGAVLKRLIKIVNENSSPNT